MFNLEWSKEKLAWRRGTMDRVNDKVISVDLHLLQSNKHCRRERERMRFLLAFSEYLPSFSAPHRLDNGMGCPSPLPLSEVETALFSSDIEKN